MKKHFFALAFFTAVSFFPFLALAASHGHVRSEPVKTVTPSAAVVSVAPTTSSTAPFGFNFGDDLCNTGTLNSQLETWQLNYAKSKGVTHLRFAYWGANNPCEEAGALQAQAAGMYVIVGMDWGTFSQSQFAQYENEAIQQFTWCQTHGIKQCSLGNEQEYRLGNGVTQSAWASDLRTMATAVKAVYNGTISYETSGDFASEWDAQSLGSIGLFGLNLYNSYYPSNAQALQNEINAHGVAHVYLSELACDLGSHTNSSGVVVQNVPACHTDAGLSQETANDAVKLKAAFPNTQMYYFTFSANGGDEVPSFWGIYNGTTLQYPLTAQTLGI